MAVRDSLVIFHCVKVNDVPSLEIIGIPRPFPTGEPVRTEHLSMQISRIGMSDMQRCIRGRETESVLTGEQRRGNETYTPVYPRLYVHTYSYRSDSGKQMTAKRQTSEERPLVCRPENSAMTLANVRPRRRRRRSVLSAGVW